MASRIFTKSQNNDLGLGTNNLTSNYFVLVLLQAVASAAHNNQCKVRFKLCEDEANSSNPSDSNNSTSTDSGNPKSNPNSNPAHRAPSQPPQPAAATTTTGRQISNMSGASSSGDEFDRQSSFAGNP